MTNLIEAITKEDLTELKTAMKEIAISQMREDLGNVYLVDTEEYSSILLELLKEIKEEIKAEIKKEYGDVIKDQIIKSLSKL